MSEHQEKTLNLRGADGTSQQERGWGEDCQCLDCRIDAIRAAARARMRRFNLAWWGIGMPALNVALWWLTGSRWNLLIAAITVSGTTIYAAATRRRYA